MNTRLVDPRTMWAVLAMEAALALPVMSLPTQGDRLTGLPGPILLLALLPLGYVAVYRFRELRDPSWRLLIGIGLALATRLVVSDIPENGLLVWLGQSVVPAVIGVGLWWRGGALAVAELTPSEVRTEFTVVAICLLAALALVRPFLLPNPLLLGGAVGMFAIGGLLATALSRQDAADVSAPRSSGALGIVTGLAPAGAAVVLVGILRPELLSAMWFWLGRAIELALTPLGLLLAWLGSLFPRATPGALPTPPPRPTAAPIDPGQLAEAQEKLAWVATAIAVILLIAAGFALILAARLLLQNWIGDPRRRGERNAAADLVAEASGTPRDDAADLWGWLMRWLRNTVVSRPAASRAAVQTTALDAWTAYRRLLTWADAHGMSRRPSETTGQLAARISQHTPVAAHAVDVVTQTYEWERYGAVHPSNDRLQSVREALKALTDG